MECCLLIIQRLKEKRLNVPQLWRGHEDLKPVVFWWLALSSEADGMRFMYAECPYCTLMRSWAFLMVDLWPARLIIYGASCRGPAVLPEEIRLDLWLSFTSPWIRAAVCSDGPRAHESNFIDQLESYRHPLNTKCLWKGHGVRGWGEMSAGCGDWKWDYCLDSPGCDETVEPDTHKYLLFAPSTILYHRRGL